MAKSQTKKVNPKAKSAKVPEKKTAPSAEAKKKVSFAFTRMNYILMLAGLFLIVLGFGLMAGGGSNDPNVFSTDIFNTQRLTVAPIIILLGYVVEIVAIMYKPKEKKADELA